MTGDLLVGADVENEYEWAYLRSLLNVDTRANSGNEATDEVHDILSAAWYDSMRKMLLQSDFASLATIINNSTTVAATD